MIPLVIKGASMLKNTAAKNSGGKVNWGNVLNKATTAFQTYQKGKTPPPPPRAVGPVRMMPAYKPPIPKPRVEKTVAPVVVAPVVVPAKTTYNILGMELPKTAVRVVGGSLLFLAAAGITYKVATRR